MQQQGSGTEPLQGHRQQAPAIDILDVDMQPMGGSLTHAASNQFTDHLAADEIVSLPRAVAYSGYVVSIGVLLRSSFMITNGSKQPDVDVITYSLYWLALGAVLQHVGY